MVMTMMLLVFLSLLREENRAKIKNKKKSKRVKSDRSKAKYVLYPYFHPKHKTKKANKEKDAKYLFLTSNRLQVQLVGVVQRETRQSATRPGPAKARKKGHLRCAKIK